MYEKYFPSRNQIVHSVSWCIIYFNCIIVFNINQPIMTAAMQQQGGVTGQPLVRPHYGGGDAAVLASAVIHFMSDLIAVRSLHCIGL